MNSSPTLPILEGRHLQKTYELGRASVPVLHDASLEVAQGEWVTILGSSGSGKSTMLHLLGGLDRPDEGGGDDENSGCEQGWCASVGGVCGDDGAADAWARCGGCTSV